MCDNVQWVCVSAAGEGVASLGWFVLCGTLCLGVDLARGVNGDYVPGCFELWCEAMSGYREDLYIGGWESVDFALEHKAR